MRSHFKWLDQQHGLSEAKKIVLAGSVAGGTGVFLWVDYLRDMAKNKDEVYGIADSAVYFDPPLLSKIRNGKDYFVQFFMPPDRDLEDDANKDLRFAGYAEYLKSMKAKAEAGGALTINPTDNALGSSDREFTESFIQLLYA